MKKLLLIITVILTSVSAVWAEDYSQGYYTMSPGTGNTYFGFYSSSNADSKYGGTEIKTSAVIFTFEKTNLDNVYYWYDCNNHKYIYSDNSGYLKVSDNKDTNDNNYKWFIKENNDGTLTIADMTTYNDGNLESGLIQLTSVGGWWASKCNLSYNSGRNTWKLNLLMKKNTPYYISLPGRAADCYLQYNENKMQQAAVNEKGTNHVWYFTDAGNGVVNIYSLENQNNAMGYASNAGNGDDKISTTNSDKAFYIRLTGNDSAPLAFLTNAIDKNNSLYLSNNGGTGKTNMGLWQEVDEGTRMKIEEITFEECINSARSILDGTRVGHPGFHTIETNTTLQSAITTAESIESPTLSDFYDLLTAINTFKSSETIKLVQGKTYRFVSASTAKSGYVISADNNNKLIWEAEEAKDYNQLWKVTWTSTGLLATIQNVGTGLYPQGQSYNSTNLTKYQFELGQSPTNTQIVNLGSNRGQFNIIPNSQHAMHILNWSGSNTTDKIISYDNTNVNDPSAWYIYEYEEYNIKITGDNVNGRIIINGVEYANGEKFYNFKNADFTTSAKIINYYYAGNVSISGNTISLEYTSMDITVPDGSNGFVAGIRSIGETEWKTKEYWSLSDNWNDYGPGCSVSGSAKGMWNPIYLKDVTASGISFEGWKLRIKLENSTLTASTKKLQSSDPDNVTIDVDEKSSLTLTMSDDNVDPGKHVFNIDGTLTINTNSDHFTDSSNDNRINIGESGKLYFKANSAVTHSTSFTINVTPTEPTNYNVVKSRVFAELTNVTLSNLTFSATGTKNWERVTTSLDDLTTQTATGEHYYYYIGTTTESGVTQYTLYTYKQIIYEVASDAEKLSEIDNYQNLKYINIPSGKKLIIDINLEDEGLVDKLNINAAASTSIIQINEGITLYSANIIDSQTPKIIGAGTFKTTTYTASVPLNVTLGTDWTGIVSRANATVGGAFYFDNLVNSTNSKVQVTSVTGWIEGNSTTNANIILINGANNYGFCVNGTNDNNSYRFTGKIQGTGNFTYDQSNQEGYNRSPIYYFSGDLSDWTGKFILKENGTGTTTVNVTSTGNINAGFLNSSTKTNILALNFESNSQQNINGVITKSGSGSLNISLQGTGTKTIANNITANNLTIVNSNGAEITISGNRTINIINLNAYTDNNNTISSLNINMSPDDIAAKLGDDELCTLISVTGNMNASLLQINGQDHVTVGDYDYYISYNDNAIILSRRYYSRNVTSGNFGSICIPNGALVSQMTGIAKVLEVTEITTDRVNMIEVEEMTPGVPYIFKSNATTINLTLKGETATEPNNSTQNYLVGNFETPVFVPISDNSNTYYILQSNQFRKVTEASTIKSGSNRCYLKVPVTPSSSRQAILGIDIDEDSATGIDAINSLINNDTEIYDLNGRRLNDLRKGINIVNGVKVIVK